MRFGYVATSVLLVAFAPIDLVHNALAVAASTLFEALPFVALAALLRSALPPGVAAFAGCGCAPGPSARSVPAAICTWLSFGPAVAIGRFCAACIVARLRARRDASHRGYTSHHEHDSCAGAAAGVLADLTALVPAALGASAAQALEWFEPTGTAPWIQFAMGALAGAVCAPCGIATAALAASLHARAPLAAAGLLCTAGIIDTRSFARRNQACAPDVLAFGILAAAALTIGLHRGTGFVNPTLGLAVFPCGLLAIVATVYFRRASNGAARIAPAIMLAGAVAGSPAPQYRATETTMAGLFAGEHLTFTGTISHRDVIERYAITCCRADAVPVAVRCTHALPFMNSAWVQADGTVVVRNGGEFALDVSSVRRVAAPPDPFVYR